MTVYIFEHVPIRELCDKLAHGYAQDGTDSLRVAYMQRSDVVSQSTVLPRLGRVVTALHSY